MSEKRKKALVAYLAGLFGVAFIIVAFSLAIQINKNTINATSADKVIALQEEVQQLKDEKQELQDNILSLSGNLSEVLDSMEYLEGKAYEYNARIKGQDRLIEIYQYLAAYHSAALQQDEEAMQLHLLQLKESAMDAQALDQELYEMIKTILIENESETDE